MLDGNPRLHREPHARQGIPAAIVTLQPLPDVDRGRIDQLIGEMQKQGFLAGDSNLLMPRERWGRTGEASTSGVAEVLR